MLREIRLQLNLVELRQAYMFANTPGYLVRRFLSDLSVRELTSNFALEDLLFALSEISDMRKEEREIDDIVVAYSCLIILGQFPGYKRKALESGISRVLDWVDEVLEYSAVRRTGNIRFHSKVPMTSNSTSFSGNLYEDDQGSDA